MFNFAIRQVLHNGEVYDRTYAHTSEDVKGLSVYDDVSIIGDICDKRNIFSDNNEKFKYEAMLVIISILAKVTTNINYLLAITVVAILQRR